MKTNRIKRRGNGDRSMWNAGKGDADRSPEWRKHYDEVSWPKSNDGFRQVGGKQIKRYGPALPKPDDKSPSIVIH